MKVKLVCLADFAQITREGKLNILGIFDRIFIGQLPVVHAQMQIVFRLEADYAERDRKHKVELTLDDPDGKRLFGMQAEVVASSPRPGSKIVSDQILTLNNLRFEQLGGHTFNIFLNGHLDTQLTLEVERLTERPTLPGT